MPREAETRRSICHLELSLLWVYISPKRRGKEPLEEQSFLRTQAPVTEADVMVLYKFLLLALNVIVRLCDDSPEASLKA